MNEITKPNIGLWCDTCKIVLDKWIVDSQSSGVFYFNDIKNHKSHFLLIKVIENIP